MRLGKIYKSIWKLGLPIVVSQLGMIVVGFADNIMVGQYSTEALASASFVNNVFNVAILCCIGFTYGILPLAGALFGKSEYLSVGRLMRTALWLNTAFSLGVSALMAILYAFVDKLGQPAELLPLIRPYYLLYLAGILPVALFNVFAQWSYAIKNTVMPMWIVLAANVVNIFGNYVTIYGKLGFPELGLLGAGISTLIGRAMCPVAIMMVFFLSRKYAEYKRGFLGDGAATNAGTVWRTSIPIGLQMAFETGAFSVAAVMAGWLGAVELAAFQIIIIVGMLGFTLYYAIGSATAVLVSNEAGAGNCEGMRRVGWAGYHVMLVVAACSTSVFIFCAKPLMHMFTSDAAVLATSVSLVVPLALYQLGDATQITFANALRGTSHVMPMLWIAFASYMVVGVPATYLLGFVARLGIYGIVLSFSISLFMAGVLFLAFFLRATRKGACERKK